MPDESVCTLNVHIVCKPDGSRWKCKVVEFICKILGLGCDWEFKKTD